MSHTAGILVHGDNHLVLRGPLPDRAAALAMVREWSLVEIGKTRPATLGRWRISTREFREELEWAVVAPGDRETSPAVADLLSELADRGVLVHNTETENW